MAQLDRTYQGFSVCGGRGVAELEASHIHASCH